jgi:hypothetical protein
MNLRTKVLISVLIFTVMIAIALNCQKLYANSEKNSQIIKHVIIEDDVVETPLDNILVDWVYNNSNLPKSLSEEIVMFVNENCSYPRLVLSIILQESDFRIFVYRKQTNVYGLGQIKYDIWKDEIKQFGIEEARDLYDWKKNILAINYIINKYYNESGDPEKALRKYVGEVNNDMTPYCNNILKTVGYLSLLSGKS